MLSFKEGMIHCVRQALSIPCFQHGQVSTSLSQNSISPVDRISLKRFCLGICTMLLN